MAEPTGNSDKGGEAPKRDRGRLGVASNTAASKVVSDFVNGYKTVLPTGSRGDVMAESNHNGTAWNVEFKRALDTGNSLFYQEAAAHLQKPCGE